MNNLTPIDSHQRKHALDPGNSFIIQAPAGSGKTELITQRYLKLLTTVEHPEEIVAITFTNKAVAQMQERIIKSLLMAQKSPPTKAHELVSYQLAKAVLKRSQEKGWSLFENPQRLKISTIDAFCFRLTGQLPIASQFGAKLNITDDAQFLYNMASERIFDLLDEKEAWSEALTILCLHLGNNLEHIKELLSTMLGKRDQWLGFTSQDLKSDTLRQELEAAFALENANKLEQIHKELSAPIATELLAIIRYASVNLESSDPIYSVLSQTSTLPAPLLENKERWQKIVALFLTGDQKWRKQATNQIGFPAPSSSKNKQEKEELANWKQRYKNLVTEMSAHESLLGAMRDTLSLPDTQYTEDQWLILNALLTLLPVAAAELRLLFIQESTVDYIENTLAALMALGDDESPSDLALILDHQIKHLLVDEFQDTSHSQFQLIQRLTAGWENNDGRSLFLVGDPMQSIYRFRQAEVGLFIQAREDGIGNVRLTPLTLSTNFRSTTTIVNWINETFQLAFPKKENIQSGVVIYSPSEAVHPSVPTSSIQCFTQIEDKTRKNEASKIALQIGQIRKKQPNDSIAILVRSRKHLSQISPALKRIGISFQAIEIEHLATQQMIQDLLALTKAMRHLADKIAWLSLLRAPWCGLTLADITILSTSSEENAELTVWQNLNNMSLIETLSKEGQMRVAHLLPPIIEAIQQRKRVSLRTTIETLWVSLNGQSALLDPNRINDAQAYFDLLSTLENQFPIISHDLLEKKTARLFSNIDTHSDGSVQLMTIHKSKGMEFDHVFLPSLDKRPVHNEKQLLIWQEKILPSGKPSLLLAPIYQTHRKDSRYDFIRQLEQEKIQHELTRVLYVAATRSKKALYLFANLSLDPKGNPKPPEKNSFLALFWKHCETDFLDAITSDNTEEEAASTEKKSQSLHRLTLSALNLEKTELTDYQLDDSNTPELTLHEKESSAITGIVIHSLLQNITLLGEQWWESIKQTQTSYIQSLYWENGMLPQEAEIEKVLQAVTNTLADQNGRWVLFSKHHSDAELSIQHIKRHHSSTLIIDRTFVDENDVRWIIDYKTADNTLPQVSDFLNHASREHYPQLKQYQQAFEKIETRKIKLALYFPMLPELFIY
jgi:ATP-dependent helicase/nuclease subunit A